MAFAEREIELDLKKGRQTGIKKSSSWNPGWMFNNREKTGTYQRQLLHGEKGKEMNVQLYFSFLNKTTSSKTLWRLEWQKIDALLPAFLTLFFLTIKVKSACTRFGTWKNEGDEPIVTVTERRKGTCSKENKPHSMASQCSKTQRQTLLGAVVPSLKQTTGKWQEPTWGPGVPPLWPSSYGIQLLVCFVVFDRVTKWCNNKAQQRGCRKHYCS